MLATCMIMTIRSSTGVRVIVQTKICAENGRFISNSADGADPAWSCGGKAVRLESGSKYRILSVGPCQELSAMEVGIDSPVWPLDFHKRFGGNCTCADAVALYQSAG